MEDSVQHRIRELIRDENLKIYEFEKKIGAANSYVNSIRKSISPYYLENIAKAFPSWNVSWIMTGLGNKFNVDDVKVNNKPAQTMGERKERLFQFMRYKGLTVRAFERNCGLSNGYLRNTGDSFGGDILNRIATAYKDLNISWVLSGEGSMLKVESASTPKPVSVSTPEPVDDSYMKTLQGLAEIVRAQQQTIDRLISIQLQTERHNDEGSKDA